LTKNYQEAGTHPPAGCIIRGLQISRQSFISCCIWRSFDSTNLHFSVGCCRHCTSLQTTYNVQ